MDYLKFTKMLVGTILAILIAEYLNLHNAFSAGLITILSITDTKKATYKLSLQRLASLLLGFVVGLIVFYFLGYSLVSFCVLLLFYIPISMIFNLMVGLVPSLVLLGHIMLEKQINFKIFLNEFSLLLIAVFISGLLNLYMPSQEKEIKKLKLEIETSIKEVFYIFYLKLTPSTSRNIIEEKIPEGDIADILKCLDNNISKLNIIVAKEDENTLFKKNLYNKKYVLTRRNQYNVLVYMTESLKLIQLDIDHGARLAALFYLTAEQVSEMNTCKYILEDIDILLGQFKKEELPKSREEFEDRAILYKLLTDFRRFLKIKYNFIQQCQKNNLLSIYNYYNNKN